MMPDNNPSIDPSALPSIHVADHAVHGLFHLDLDFGSAEWIERTLRETAEQVRAIPVSQLPVRLQLPRAQPGLQSPLWELPSGKGMALDDFYPYARQILGAKAEDATVCVNLRLSSEGVQSLTQVLGGKPRLWQLHLGQAAQKRCGRAAIALQFDNARLFVFRTGVVILDLSWRYVADGDALPASALLEGNYLLSHGNHPGKSPATPADAPAPLDALRLLEVAQALLPESWAKTSPLRANRLLLHTLARLQGSADEEAMIEFGIRLSHRQTTDYRPKQRPLESQVVQPFPYLCHVLAPEGAASVLTTTEAASSFFSNFVRGSGTNTYVPLFVASLHNHLWLLAQTEWLPAQAKSDKRHEVHDLEELYERTVEFRRFFYFPMVSQISLHNAFYERSQQVFKIAERQRFLEQTTHDIAELLKARRGKWIGRISGAVAGFLVGHELLDIVSQSGLPYTMPNLRVWWAETAHATPAVVEPLVRLVERWDVLVFLGSLASALVGYWLAWNFDKSPKGE